MTASLLHSCRNILGEGPLWHAERKSCFWVDIEGFYLYEYTWKERTVKSRKMESYVTMIVQGEGDQLLLGMKGGLARYHLDSGKLDWVTDIDKDIVHHRCNDGACDSRGRVWVGTMDMKFTKESGTLYCVDENLVIKKKLDHISISNGLAWSADNTKLYYIDSPKHTVEEYHFDEATGDIRFERDAICIPENMGTPDGMAMDEEGMLWVAHWGGFGVFRWNPFNGALLGSIDLPVPNVTSCAFAGEQLDHLIITTARENLTEKELAEYPDSGGLFIARPGVKGLPVYKCRI